MLSLVVYCCSCCRFLLFVPSPARNIFVQIRVIGYAELKVRGKKYSFRAMRGTLLLFLVVLCCFCCRFLLSIPSSARNPFVYIRVIGYAELKVRGKKYSFRAPRGTFCCLVLFLLSFSPAFSPLYVQKNVKIVSLFVQKNVILWRIFVQKNVL